jgi:Protein of unknown function (DUF2934)
MPKAPRDKGSSAPKKRNRKAAPANGNGLHAENGTGVGAASATVSIEVTPKAHVQSNMEELIRRRAYEIYLERGDNGGSPEQDWLRAVEEICGRTA